MGTTRLRISAMSTFCGLIEGADEKGLNTKFPPMLICGAICGWVDKVLKMTGSTALMTSPISIPWGDSGPED